MGEHQLLLRLCGPVRFIAAELSSVDSEFKHTFKALGFASRLRMLEESGRCFWI